MMIPARLRPSAFLSRLLLGLLLLCCLLSSAAAWATADPAELLEAGRADEALRQLSPQATGSNAAAYNYLGRVYFSLQDWDNALRNCERAAQLEPRNAIYQLWLGRSYGEKANVSNPIAAFALARKTVAAFIAAHSLDRDNMAVARDLAEYYSTAPAIVGGGTGKARALAAEIAPNHPADAAWVRAMADASEGHYDEAEREYLEAIRLAHDSATTYLDYAGFLRGRKSWDRFQQTIERAMQSQQIRPADRFNAASLLLKTDRDMDEAAREMRAYVQGEHTDEEAPVFRAHYLLGEIYLKTGDTSRASDEYKAALALASSYRPATEALRRLATTQDLNTRAQH